MNGQELALIFPCAGEALVGILALPATRSATDQRPAADTAVVMIVGGPQYRAGSHRQFTLLARAIADAGHPVLRFDYRGMGDSGGEPRAFEAVSQDIAAAINITQQELPAVRRFVLCGLCDGASAALLYLESSKDARVGGLCLINPWVRSDASLALTHVKHYYLQRLRQREFWLKLARGGVAGGAVRDLLRSLGQLRAHRSKSAHDKSVSTQTFQQLMASAAAMFRGELLLVLSAIDYTSREFAEHARTNAQWQRRLSDRRTTRLHIAGADHTFSSWGSQQTLHTAVVSWLENFSRAP